MRIVQVVENLAVGGLERMVVDLAKEQARCGHEVSICCLFEPGLLAEEAAQAGIPVRSLHKTPGFSFGAVRRMASFLREARAEVVHGHNPGVHHYAALAARWAGTHVVVNTRHGVSNSQGKRFEDRWFRMVLPLTSRVVFVSRHSQAFYIDNGIIPASISSVIVNGIPQLAYEERAACPGARLPRLRFGNIARMVPVKGQATLIEAFSRIAPELPGAELVIVGGGDLHSGLEAMVRDRGIEDRVRIEGPTRDVAGVLSQLDVFAFSSTSEGLPLVILEALAAGLPIVSTRVGGVPEVAPEGEVAWYCEPGDVDGMARALLLAARDPALTDKGRKARQRARSLYTVQTMAKQYEDLYRECSNR